MKIVNLLSLIGVLIILASCSNSQEQIQNKWWKELKTGKHTKLSNTDIVFFGKNGEIKVLNEGTKNYKYEIKGNELNYLKDGKVAETEYIKELTDSTLTLAENKESNEVRKYVLADNKDFIAGKWEGIFNDIFYKITIDYTNKDYWIYKENNDKYQSLNLGNEHIGVYDVNYTTFFKDGYQYELSENKNELTLKNENNLVKLYRESYLNDLKKEGNINPEIAVIIEKDSLNTLVENINYSINNILALNINSENDLINIFGKKYVSSKIDTNYYGEEDFMVINYVSILYPNTSDEITFKWEKDNLSKLTNIVVDNEYSSWTYNDIKIGLTLKELEKINGKPFTFYGFDMDAIPVGEISSFENGKLDSKQINIEFNYKELLSGMGYDPISSNSEIAQQANPTIKSFSVIIKN